MLDKVKLSYIGLAIVLMSAFGWYYSTSITALAGPPIGLSGHGLSLEFHLLSFLNDTAPEFSFALHVLLFPVLSYYFAYKIIRIFLDDRWATILALLFFSNLAGYPFHIFLLDLTLGSLSHQATLKMTDMSTVIGLAVLLRLLRPQSMYKQELISTFALLTATVFLDSLDGSAISVVYVVILSFKYFKYPTMRKSIPSYLIGIITVWIANIWLLSSGEPHIADIPQLNSYVTLYFVLPAFLFAASFFTLGVDYYQVQRRFGGLLVVFLSELMIFGLHYADIFKVQLSEVQFQSIFPMFHILYFVPTLMWISNSNFARLFLTNRLSVLHITVKNYLSFGFLAFLLLALALYNITLIP